MVKVDGMLLAPGTTILPNGLRYAYVADGGNGTPLVANGFKYNSKESPFAPKKFGGVVHAAPLPSFWVCNSTSLLYEQMDETGQVMASSVPRPPPNKISSRSLGDVQRLRREYELAAIQVVGKGDSDSYLSLVGVEARDKEFNLMWGFPESRRWLAARKEVYVPNVGGDGQWPEDFVIPAGTDAWDINDALKTKAAAVAAGPLAVAEPGVAGVVVPVGCLNRPRFWELMGGSILNSSLHPAISAPGNHVTVSGWYAYAISNQLSDGIEVVKLVCGKEFDVSGEGSAATGIFTDAEHLVSLKSYSATNPLPTIPLTAYLTSHSHH